MINETKTLELFGYTSNKLLKGSHKIIVKICERCDEETLVKFRHSNSKCCRKCYKLPNPKPKFVKEQDRFIPNTNIDRIETIKQFGYDPVDLNKGSNKKVWSICDECKQGRFIQYRAYRNICKLCSKSKPKIILDCQQCGDKFSVVPSLKNQQFCSKKCVNKWRSINLVGENATFYGHHHTKEQNKKHSKFMSGRNNPQYGKIGKDSSRFGKHHSEETKIQMSCSHQKIDIENFNGFTTKSLYCSKFNNQLKIKIRERYNNCDYISGIHKDICNNGINLDVHHINYDKQCGCNDTKCKLIPLNSSNHGKTNYKRSFWNRLFIYSLEYDKEYYNDSINIWEMI